MEVTFALHHLKKKNGCSVKILAIIQINEYNRGYERGGKTWLIPYGSMKPADGRKNNHSQRGASEC